MQISDENQSLDNFRKMKIDLISPSPYPSVRDLVPDWLQVPVDYYKTNGKNFRSDLFKHIASAIKLSESTVRVMDAILDLFQLSILMLDDIFDNSTRRRGEKCMHLVHGPTLVTAWAIGITHHIYRISEEHLKDKASKFSQLYNEVGRRTLRGQCMELTIRDYEKIAQYKTAYYTVCFPVAVAVLLKHGNLDDAMRILDDSDLLRLGYLFQTENDFLGVFDVDNTDIEMKSWTVLVDMIAKKDKSFAFPGSRDEAEVLYEKHDIYKAYVQMREDLLAQLQFELVNGSRNNHGHDWTSNCKHLTMEFCLTFFETYKYQGELPRKAKIVEMPSLLKGNVNLNVLKFNMDSIHHPQYGAATFCGEIPLLRPFQGATDQEISKLDMIASKLIQVGRVVWEHEDDDHILSKLRQHALASSLMSGMEWSHPRLPLLVLMLVLGFSGDDELDTQTGSNIQKMVGAYKDFVTDSQKRDWFLDQPIQSVSINMAHMLRCFDRLKAKWYATIPNFRAKWDVAVADHLYRFASAHSIQSELEKKGQTFSCVDTKRYLLRAVNMAVGIVEYIAILQDVEIPDYVRRDILFTVATNKVADIQVLGNALLGLPRDIRLGQVDSSIMDDVTSGAMSLQEAINKAHRDLVASLGDLKVATEMLLEVYGDYDAVVKFVGIMISCADGYLCSYKYWDRYGVTESLILSTN